jgi:hypothetical protein
VALRLDDPIDKEIPNVGFLPIKDPETDKEDWIWSSSKKARTKYKAAELKRCDALDKMFSRAGIDHTVIRTDRDFVKPLMQLFDRRG